MAGVGLAASWCLPAIRSAISKLVMPEELGELVILVCVCACCNICVARSLVCGGSCASVCHVLTSHVVFIWYMAVVAPCLQC